MTRLDTRRCGRRYELTAQDADDPHGLLWGAQPKRVVLWAYNEARFVARVAEYLRDRKAAA